MKIALVGRADSPIIEKVRDELCKEHWMVWFVDAAQLENALTYDIIVYCTGHDYQSCVTDLLTIREHGDSFIVVTSEHGSIPISDPKYTEYQAIKAAQKMVCRCFNRQGIPTVDISPAFIQDSGRAKRMNTDLTYRELIQEECNGDFPIMSGDVAEAIVFAIRNIGKIAGTTIKVSAGWRQ